MMPDDAVTTSDSAGDQNAMAQSQEPAQPRALTADAQQASPDEQAQYDKFVSKAFLLVYNEKFLPKAVKMLEGEGDPVEGLARLSAMVIQRIMQLASQAGQELHGEVLFHAGKEVFEDLAELSRHAGIKDFSKDEDAMEAAYFRALDYLRSALQGSGELNQKAAQGDLSLLQKMDQDGELEGLFQQLASQDEAGRGQPDTDDAAPADDQAPAQDPDQADAPPPRRGGLMQGMN